MFGLLLSALLTLQPTPSRGKCRHSPAGRTLSVTILATVLPSLVFMYPAVGEPVQTRLLADDNTASDAFGTSVAVDGELAVVGACGKRHDRGAAYVFVRSNASWMRQATLVPADAKISDNFGYCVGLSGETVIVGAYEKTGPVGADQGSAYVFTRSGTSWTQQAKLVAADARVYGYFGVSVALNGDTAIVGSDEGGECGSQTGAGRGAAYVFTRSGATWTQQAKLVASDGALRDLFGISVSIGENVAVVGASTRKGLAGQQQGAAYVFVRAGAIWEEQAKLEAADAATGDCFGISVALSGDDVIVGAWKKDGTVHRHEGAAYVFRRTDATWGQQAKLVASDAGDLDDFGRSAALSGDMAIVGAWTKAGPAGISQGAAYLFVRAATGWKQQLKLIASDAAGGDGFGRSVAIRDGVAVVGAGSKSGPLGALQGAAYSFFPCSVESLKANTKPVGTPAEGAGKP